MADAELLLPDVELETKRVLKQLARSHRALAELKGFADKIPNKNILMNAATINEAKDSSEIENIVTTHDELLKAMSLENYNNPAAKEVLNCRTALLHGYEMVKDKHVLTASMIVEIRQLIEKNRTEIGKVPDTATKNEATGEEKEIANLLNSLEKYINDDCDSVDPLVKSAVIHYQFGMLHPFYEGYGRTGRIVNVLYLILKELLDSPILYLSKYIVRNKSTYYRLLQDVRTKGSWEEWILFLLDGMEQTAQETLLLVKRINDVVEKTAEDIKAALPKLYSKKLVNLLFCEFYTKIAYIEEGLNITRKTASNYLSLLEEKGFLESKKVGKERIFMNKCLFEIIQQAGVEK